MELNIFIRELKSALVRRGISEDRAARHVATLSRTFTSDDLSEIDAIESNDEIEQLADSISVILTKNKSAVKPVQPRETQKAPAAPPPAQAQVQRERVQSAPPPLPKIHLPEDDYGGDFGYGDEPVRATTKGMLIFWVGLFLTLPISLALLIAIFGSFAAVFVGLSALILAGIVALIGIVAAGAGVSLVGIIFGITQLFSFTAAGIYEIGLGVMVAGAVLFVSVLVYNISIRFLPWLITLVGNLLGIVCGKLKELFLRVRRECYKL